MSKYLAKQCFVRYPIKTDDPLVMDSIVWGVYGLGIESYLCMCCNRVLKYVAEAADKQVCPRERSRADEGALMSGCPSPLYLISAGLRSGTWDRACWRRLLLCPNKRLQTCPCHLLKGAARVSLSHSYTHTHPMCFSLLHSPPNTYLRCCCCCYFLIFPAMHTCSL